MKRKIIRNKEFFGLLVVVCCFSGIFAESAEPALKAISLRGVAQSMDEDAYGKPCLVAVEVPPKPEDAGFSYPEYYFIVDNSKGRELYRLIGKEVSLAGTLKEDENGVKWVTIKAFKPVNDSMAQPESEKKKFNTRPANGKK